MPHVIERAASGRAKCRGCGTGIAKGDFRVGEAVPNLYVDTEGAETTHWYHQACAAFRRPEAFLQAVQTSPAPLLDHEALVASAHLGATYRRVPRVDRAGRAPAARATCRACRVLIQKGQWRISLLFWQDGRFAPAGFIHAACAGPYLETTAIIDRLRYFTPDLTDADVDKLARELATEPVR